MVLILCICCWCLCLRNIFRTEYFPEIYSYALDGFVPDRLIVSYGERGCSNLPIILKMLSITILLKYFADVAFVKLYFATIVTEKKNNHFAAAATPLNILPLTDNIGITAVNTETGHIIDH